MKICKALVYADGTMPESVKYYSSQATAEKWYEDLDDWHTVRYEDIEVIDGWPEEKRDGGRRTWPKSTSIPTSEERWNS